MGPIGMISDYYIVDGDVRFMVDDDPERMEWRYICPALGSEAETFERLERAGWPTGDGEIPCSLCGEFMATLDSLCGWCLKAGADG
jgi:hypothetical protein